MENNDQVPQSQLEPFSIRDCALVSIATGISAQNLREFRDGLKVVPPGSIYHHFWGRLLQPRFDEPEYNNGFASWTYRALNDKALAERLSVLDPKDFANIEDLRQELIEIVEMRLDESELVPWAQADQQFHFIRSQIVVFDTDREVHDPKDLAGAIAKMSLGSIFYHFIDARRRTDDHSDDFSAWLSADRETYSELIWLLGSIDPFFASLRQTRETLGLILGSYLNGSKEQAVP